MDKLRACEVFVQVVDLKSFVKAADQLGLSTTAVSRHVADLEEHLQVRLLQRTTRRVSPTEAGLAFYERGVQILAEFDEAEREASQRATEPRGTLRITTSVNLGTRKLAPLIAAFMARHPAMRFDLSIADRFVDLVEEGFDLAVRYGGTGGENLIARRLGEARLVLCASPSYIAKHGTPTSPEQLARHNCLTYEYALRDTWTFRGPDGRESVVRVSGSLHSNNGDLLAAAAARGAGITLEPDFIVRTELEQGSLVKLLPSFEPPSSPIYAVYPSRRFLPAKLRLFVDFLVEQFSATPPAP